MYPFFFPDAEDLPETLPIFPLEGAVVMPLSELPLNIFEPRYLDMVSDALAGHRMFGMVQPKNGRGESVELYGIGCAGRITAYSETTDGRVLLTLTGVSRFDIAHELPGTRGYRLVRPEWSRFLADLRPQAETKPSRRASLLNLLRGYFSANDLRVDWTRMEQLSSLQLVHNLVVALPLEPGEKQMVVEAVAPSARLSVFEKILQFSLTGVAGGGRH